MFRNINTENIVYVLNMYKIKTISYLDCYTNTDTWVCIWCYIKLRLKVKENKEGFYVITVTKWQHSMTITEHLMIKRYGDRRSYYMSYVISKVINCFIWRRKNPLMTYPYGNQTLRPVVIISFFMDWSLKGITCTKSSNYPIIV